MTEESFITAQVTYPPLPPAFQSSFSLLFDSLTLLLAEGQMITYLTGVLWGFPLTLAAMLGKPLGGKAL